jgi:protein-S-isoprenylcysteine O-methyltransferase Ste14
MDEPQTPWLAAITLAWLSWAAAWAVLSQGVKPVVRHESRASRALHVVPLVVGGVLLIKQHGLGWLGTDIVPRAAWMAPAGCAVTFAGLAFAVWARLVLGVNWSGTVTVKRGHELVRTGPYALARHPIYTGMLSGLLGTALAVDAWRALAAFVIVTVAFLRKLRTEEAFMRAEFGAAYDTYRAEVPALVPRLWRRLG